MAFGLSLALGPVFLILMKKGFDFKVSKSKIISILLLSTLLIIHLFFASLYFPEAINIKSIISILYFFLLSLSALILYTFLQRANKEKLHQSIYFLFFILSCILFLKSIFILSNNSIFNGKAMFIFKEPSHFALIYSIFLMYFMICPGRYKGSVFLFVVICSLLIESLALVSAALISLTAYFVTIRNKRVFLILIVLVPFLIGVVFLLGDAEYFTERLMITEESENLSVLVFLSGFERALLVYEKSGWLGGGFQSMGNLGVYGSLQDKILNLSGGHLNIQDGGTLAAKIIFEFGILGIALLVLYISSFTYMMLKGPKKNDYLNKFLWSSFMCLFLSLFVRGVGYFSPSVFFALCFMISKLGVIQLRKAKKLPARKLV